MIITIDGPCSSGKGTVSSLLARSLEGAHLDSGLFYRTLAWMAAEQYANDFDALHLNANTLLPSLAKDISWIWDKDKKIQPLFQGKVISVSTLRCELIGSWASKIAKNADLRCFVNDKIRSIADDQACVVADGRDMATVVFPQADLKFFLDAPAELRAKRRYLELQNRGLECTYAEVYEKILQRDYQDRTRDIAPLELAKGAIVIQNTSESLEDLLSQMKKYVLKKSLL